MVKLLIAGDIHDDIEAFAKFADYAQSHAPDKILFLGDFSLRPYTKKSLIDLIESPRKQEDVHNFIREKRVHNGKIISEMKEILDNTGIDYLVIPGNYDPELESFGERNLNRRTDLVGEAKIVGYGSADAFPRQIQPLVQLGEIAKFNHGELYTLLKENNPSILMLHNPPQGFCDNMFNGQNAGTTAVTKYILENNPKLVLAGHIHEAGPLGNNPQRVRGLSAYKETLVVNPGNLGRFELLNEDLSTAMRFPYGTFVGMELAPNGKPISVTQYSIAGKEGKETIKEIEKITEIQF